MLFLSSGGRLSRGDGGGGLEDGECLLAVALFLVMRGMVVQR